MTESQLEERLSVALQRRIDSYDPEIPPWDASGSTSLSEAESHRRLIAPVAALALVAAAAALFFVAAHRHSSPTPLPAVATTAAVELPVATSYVKDGVPCPPSDLQHVEGVALGGPDGEGICLAIGSVAFRDGVVVQYQGVSEGGLGFPEPGCLFGITMSGPGRHGPDRIGVFIGATGQPAKRVVVYLTNGAQAVADTIIFPGQPEIRYFAIVDRLGVRVSGVEQLDDAGHSLGFGILFSDEPLPSPPQPPSSLAPPSMFDSDQLPYCMKR
jgi:hypothetical protein